MPADKRPFRVVEANKLAQRTAALATLQHRAGKFFSIENPEHSIMWLLPQMRQLAARPGVEKYSGDQCVYGGLWQKATGWLALAGGVLIVTLGISLSVAGVAQPASGPLLNEPPTRQSHPLTG